MYILMEDKESLRKYNDILNKVSNSMKKKFDRKPDFHNGEILPKVGSNNICLPLILSDFVLGKDENYYPQVFLRECKYKKS